MSVDQAKPRQEHAAPALPARLVRRLSYGLRWQTRLWLKWFLVIAGTLAVGVLVGRATASSGDAGVASANRILPLLREADAIWTGDAADLPSVARGIAVLRGDDDASLITLNGTRWLRSYDRVLVDLAAVEVAPQARAVQRELLSAIVLSRDAVEVVMRAALEPSGSRARPLLAAEAIRLRARSEAAQSSAREALSRLGAAGSSVAPEVPGDLPGFDDLATPRG